jgi:hypothetical protein
MDATPGEAAALALVYEGYLLARNERMAGHGQYVSFESASHEGHEVDEWQDIETRLPCRCTANAAKRREAA